MSKQILSVNPNLPMPPGISSDNPNNPKSTIKSLVMTSNQAQEDAKYDVPPKREGFRSPSFFNSSYLSYLCYILITVVIYIVLKRNPMYKTYRMILLIVAVFVLLVIVNLRRT